MQALSISTPSLTLRHFALTDAPAILELNREPSTRHWLSSHVYASLSEAQAALAGLIAGYACPGHPAKGPYVLAVEHQASARLLGHVGFSPLGSEVEISFAIAESARGRGLGAEALIWALQWARGAFKLPAVIAVTAAGNVMSCRALRRAYFVHVRDEIMRFQGVEQAVCRYIWQPVHGGCGEA